MLNLFQKSRAEDVTLEDLQELCDTRAEEGHTLEFKARVPDNLDGNGADRWTSKRELHDRAKRAILKAVTALANADGGWFVIGVGEDDQDRADQLEPIEACVELADRIGRVVASSIEPPLPVMSVRGVAVDEDSGSGIIVVRIGASLVRPHRMRHGDHRHVYVRRGKESLEMSMWDIQSLTLETARRAENLEARLIDSLDRYWPMPYPTEPASQTLYGYAITASPVAAGPTVENVYRLENLFQPVQQFVAVLGENEITLRSAAHSEWGPVRPTLRGGERYFQPTQNAACVLNVGWDGHINFVSRYGYSDWHLNAATVLADIANVILIARDWSKTAGASAEYALQFNVRIDDNSSEEDLRMNLFQISREYGSPFAEPIKLRGFRSPAYRSDLSDPSSVLELALNDLYNSASLRSVTGFSIDFDNPTGKEP